MATKEGFQQLAEQWEEETYFLSSPTKVKAHPAYKKIVAMGWQAVPWILEMMERPTIFEWPQALADITKQWPARREDAGKVAIIQKAWVDWGKENQLLIETMIAQGENPQGLDRDEYL